MDKTLVELFAGVGGFRLGFERTGLGWQTKWFSQWEPGAAHQWAHDCYVSHFGDLPDMNGEYRTGQDICAMEKTAIPDATLLVGGFPCQDYSVANTLASSGGIEGKKGVLWWQIRDVLAAKRPAFCLFENVDRLLKSPAKQRGRDYGIILACLNDLGYAAEWRVINAAEYGAAQKRKRVFLLAYRNDTKYAAASLDTDPADWLYEAGALARAFPVCRVGDVSVCQLDADLVSVSASFAFGFRNAGIMRNGSVYTADIEPMAEKPVTLGQILESRVDARYFVDDPVALERWRYAKSAKKLLRTSANGHAYTYSEGAVAFPDCLDKPARTLLTGESQPGRSSHIILDPEQNRMRVLTPVETERIQGFDDNWTNTGMPLRMRYFCMGNALVVPMITRIGKVLGDIVAKEP